MSLYRDEEIPGAYRFPGVPGVLVDAGIRDHADYDSEKDVRRLQHGMGDLLSAASIHGMYGNRDAALELFAMLDERIQRADGGPSSGQRFIGPWWLLRYHPNEAKRVRNYVAAQMDLDLPPLPV